MPSFDIVSKIDSQTLDNAINNAKKEILNRYDFNDSKSTVELDKKTNVITIVAENAQEGKKYTKREFSYAAFTRSFTLPETADPNNIEAEYTDGILKLNVAKKEEAKIQAREITVK